MQLHDILIAGLGAVPDVSSLQEAARRMSDENREVLAVTHGERVVGIVSLRDLALGGCGRGQDPRLTLVTEVMSGRVAECELETPLPDVLHLMQVEDAPGVLVRGHSGLPVALVSRRQVLEAMVAGEQAHGPVPEHVQRVRGGT